MFWTQPKHCRQYLAPRMNVSMYTQYLALDAIFSEPKPFPVVILKTWSMNGAFEYTGALFNRVRKYCFYLLVVPKLDPGFSLRQG